MKRTMLGIAAPAVPVAPPAPAQPAAPQAPARPAAPVQPLAPRGSLQRTMLGVSPLQPPPAGVPSSPARPVAPTEPFAAVAPMPHAQPAAPAPDSPEAQQLGWSQTMPGQALPPAVPVAPPTEPFSQAAAASAPDAGPQRGGTFHARTMLGVAMPGIAPLAPGVAKPRPDEPVAFDSRQVAPSPGRAPWDPGAPTADSRMAVPVSGGPDLQAARPPQAVPGVRPPLYKHPASIAIAAGLLLAGGALVFALAWRSPAPLRAEARLDPMGKDVLHLSCASCQDGTQIRIESSSAVVSKQTADLTLASPLAVGDNRFVVDVDRPGVGRRERVKLLVQIAYRIRPDVSRLEGEHPTLRIAVEAPHGTSVLVDGKQAALGPDGRGSQDIDLTAQCTGPADEVRMIDRAIPYSVAAGAGPASQGVANVRIAVVPLHLDAPLDRNVVATDRVLLAGRTTRAGRVVAGGRPIEVSSDGSFAQPLPLPAMGDNEISILASSAGQASRSARIVVKRVGRLEDEAREFAAKATLSFADLVADVPAHVGQPLVLFGEVVDSRVQNHQAVTLLDVQRGCSKPPCMVRVITGGDDTWARAERLRVFGTVRRLWTATGGPAGAGSPALPASLGAAASLAEVEACFVLKGR